MKQSNFHRRFGRGAAILTLVAAAAGVSAADAPTDAAAPAPAPAAAPAAGGSWFVFSPPKDGVVLSPIQREKLLTLTKTFLERDSAELIAHLKAVDNPFFAKQAPPPETVTTSTPVNAGPAAPPPVMQDGDKLQQIVDQLKPTGALIAGTNRQILFASGDSLGQGASIQVTFPGDSGPTAVTLENVSPDSFTLKLHDTAKTFTYTAKSSSASHPAPSTTPKPPSRE